MAEGGRMHTLHIGTDNAITISGVVAMDSITDREAIVRCDSAKVVIRGSQLQLYSLDSDKGQVVLHCQAVGSVQYHNGSKMSLKTLFGS